MEESSQLNVEENVENVSPEEASVVYLKLINGENVIGYAVEDTETGIFLGDVLEFVKSLGQFVPYDSFLGRDEFFFEDDYVMSREVFDEDLSKLYRQAVESYKNPTEEASGLVVPSDKKIITH